MSLRRILLWPDARLRQVCAPVTDVASVEGLVGDLFETMYDAPGRGLAAPQIGVLQRVFVMDVGWKEGEMRPRACINPQVVESSDTMVVNQEGCLSIPGVLASVTRPAQIVLRYLDLAGVQQQETLDGFEAICAQHELDHLDGLVTFDRLETATRADLLATYEGQK